MLTGNQGHRCLCLERWEHRRELIRDEYCVSRIGNLAVVHIAPSYGRRVAVLLMAKIESMREEAQFLS